MSIEDLSYDEQWLFYTMMGYPEGYSRRKRYPKMTTKHYLKLKEKYIK